LHRQYRIPNASSRIFRRTIRLSGKLIPWFHQIIFIVRR
jgi:hypothetical protein